MKDGCTVCWAVFINNNNNNWQPCSKLIVSGASTKWNEFISFYFRISKHDAHRTFYTVPKLLALQNLVFKKIL